MAICNKTGAIAIYNEVKNLFLSPFADGPVNFHTNPDGSMNVQNISKFGRSFSLVRIPYSFKLLIQELQTMNIQMRIITDENVDQMLSLSYSNNIAKLLNDKVVNDISATEGEDYENSNDNLKMHITKLKTDIRNILTTPAKNDGLNKMETTINEIDSEEPEEKESRPYIPIDIKPMDAQDTASQESVPYAPGSPAYEGSSNSDEYQPGSSSPYMPDMDSETSPILIKRPQQQQQPMSFNPMTPSDSPPGPAPIPEEKKTILEVEEKKEEPLGKGNTSEGSEGNNNENGDSSTSSSSNETKKIII